MLAVTYNKLTSDNNTGIYSWNSCLMVYLFLSDITSY